MKKPDKWLLSLFWILVLHTKTINSFCKKEQDTTKDLYLEYILYRVYTKSKKTNNSIKEMGIRMEQTLIEENTWMANKHRKISFQHH